MLSPKDCTKHNNIIFHCFKYNKKPYKLPNSVTLCITNNAIFKRDSCIQLFKIKEMNERENNEEIYSGNNNHTLANNVLNILLVDDSEIDNYINRKIFEQYGKFKCRAFLSANAALEHLIQTKIKYDYIMVDIYMLGMDGFSLIEHFNKLLLNKIHGQISILTASIKPLDRKKAASLGLKYLEKPFQIEKL
ncbi:MAG: rcp [Bacteroidota bacterium]|jgi:CheY-like chemotaxis protein|nr:rcp [Bacteroidota bacterium]